MKKFVIKLANKCRVYANRIWNWVNFPNEAHNTILATNLEKEFFFCIIQSMYGSNYYLYEFAHVTSNWENRPSSIHTHNFQKRKKKRKKHGKYV